MPAWVGVDRRNEQLQCLNHVGKPNFCELQTDSTRTTGKVRQIAKKIVLMLEASTASYLCTCGLMLSMLLPSRQGKLLIKRIGKNRGNKNQLHRALLQCCGQLLFYQNSHWISAFACRVGDRIDQIRCSMDQHNFSCYFQKLAEQQDLFTSFSVNFPKETAMWELSSLPGWALCSSYEKVGI